MECYLCESDKLTVIRNRVRHNIKRNVLLCSSCGLNFLEQIHTDIKLQAYYAESYRSQYSPRVNAAMDSKSIFDIYLPLQSERIDRLQPYFPDREFSVLDVGCSSGHFLYAIKPFASKCVGIEYNLENANFVREELGFEVYSQPVQETILPEGHFDLITVFHTLEHMEDPLGFLMTIRRYLSPSGKLYIEVPNVDDALISVYHVEAYADFWYREPHLFNFSPTTLKTLLDKAGFDGQILPVQRYSLLNHLHWVFAQSPQESADIAMNVSYLIPENDLKIDIKPQLLSYFQRINDQYYDILKKNNISDSIGFLGQAKEDK